MRKFSILMMFLAVALLVSAGSVWSATKKAEPQYVGAKKCKTCHKAQHAAWLETKHAHAYDALSDEEKKKPECVQCHITGKTAKGDLLEGIQCEACHGPGSMYKSPKIMSKKKWAADPEGYKKKAIEAGLIYPTKDNCVKCHKKEGNPNYKPFDFEKMKTKVHPTKAAAKGKKG